MTSTHDSFGDDGAKAEASGGGRRACRRGRGLGRDTRLSNYDRATARDGVEWAKGAQKLERDRSQSYCVTGRRDTQREEGVGDIFI